MFLCCHGSLTPASAIPLTLRAVGGLTTREIAAAYLVPEATMAQRISRAKQRIKSAEAPFALPGDAERGERLSSVLRVLYLLFNEGYATSAGSELARTDLSGEAVRLTRILRQRLPDDPEVAGLLALMLLTDARRPARTRAGGELVPLERQDRPRWDRALIAEGSQLIQSVFRTGPVGEYQLQAAIAAVHDDAARYADTDWPEILALYDALGPADRQPDGDAQPGRAAAMVHGRPPVWPCWTRWRRRSANTTGCTPYGPICSSEPAGRARRSRSSALRPPGPRICPSSTTSPPRLLASEPE